MSTIWVTKYALTRGILKEEGVSLDKSGKRVYGIRGSYGHADYVFVKMGKDGWENEKDAKKRAILLAKQRLITIEKEKKDLEQQIREWEK